jgi:thiamine biosynthesis protein ThiC
MSSNILNAYNKFKKIQKKHEIEKITKFKVEVAKKSNIEIKDASNFRSTVNNRDSSMPKTLLMGTVPVYNIIGSSKHELNKIRPVSALP